jgi:hypothetical protein
MSDIVDGAKIRRYTEPEYILMVLIDNSGQEKEINSGEINRFEFVAIDHSDNFREGELEWRVMQIMKDIFVEYVDYKNCGVLFRLVRNKRFRGERFN